MLTNLSYKSIEKLIFSCFFIFLMFITVNRLTSNIFLALGSIIYVFSLFITKDSPLKTLNPNWKALFISSFTLFLFTSLSYFWSIDKPSTLDMIGRRSPFLFVPMVFFLGYKINTKQLSLLGVAIIVGISIKMILTIFGIVISNDHWETTKFGSHPTYLSLYTLLSIVFLSYIKIFNWLKILLAIIFSTFILYLGSRYAIIMLALIAISLPFFLSNKPKEILLKTFLAIVVLLTITFFARNTDFMQFSKEKFSKFEEEIDPNKMDNKHFFDSRTSRWRVGFYLLSKNPLIGYGAGNEKPILTQEYKKRDMQFSYQNKFDCHFQYLSFALDAGIFMALFYIFMLIYMGIMGLKHKNYLQIYFVVLFGALCLTENMLSTNYGITSFAFLSSMFLFNKLKTA